MFDVRTIYFDLLEERGEVVKEMEKKEEGCPSTTHLVPSPTHSPRSRKKVKTDNPSLPPSTIILRRSSRLQNKE